MRGWRAWAPARRFRRASIEGEGHEYFIGSVCFVVKTVLIFFVSIRVHSWFKCIIIFVYFVLFVVKTVLIFFVSIRVHSWFKCIIIFVYFVLFVV